MDKANDNVGEYLTLAWGGGEKQKAEKQEKKEEWIRQMTICGVKMLAWREKSRWQKAEKQKAKSRKAKERKRKAKK